MLYKSRCTIDKELGRVDRGGPQISGLARVVADVTRIDRIDHEHAQALAHFGCRYARIVIDGIIIEVPLDVERQIARANQTIHRY